MNQENLKISLSEQPEWREKNLAESLVLIKNQLKNVDFIEYKYLHLIQKTNQKITALIDRKPILVHFQYLNDKLKLLNLADLKMRKQLSREIISIINRLNPLIISFHLGFSVEEMEVGGQFTFNKAKSKILSRQEVFSNINHNLNFLKSIFPGKEIILENLDYAPKDLSGCYEYVCEPEFIKKIIIQNQVGMLLDLAHAKVTAFNKKIDFYNYLFQLPLDRIKQIHMSKSKIKNGLAIDSHNILENIKDEDEISALKMLLKSSLLKNLEIIGLETFSDIPLQIKLLNKIIKESI